MLKVLIVDDHPMMRQGIKGVLEIHEDFQVVAEAEDGIQALSLVEKHNPDLVLMDVEMPKLNGMEVTRRIMDKYPDIKVLALTIHDEPEFVTGMLRAGASGYVLKRSRGPALVDSIRLASQGGMALDEEVGQTIVRGMPEKPLAIQAEEASVELSARQIQLLQWLADGLTSRQIAKNTGLSDNTIKGYLSKLMQTLGVHTRAGAVGAALRKRIINNKEEFAA